MLAGSSIFSSSGTKRLKGVRIQVCFGAKLGFDLSSDINRPSATWCFAISVFQLRANVAHLLRFFVQDLAICLLRRSRRGMFGFALRSSGGAAGLMVGFLGYI